MKDILITLWKRYSQCNLNLWHFAEIDRTKRFFTEEYLSNKKLVKSLKTPSLLRIVMCTYYLGRCSMNQNKHLTVAS